MRVRLLPYGSWPEEFGSINDASVNGVYLVQLESEYYQFPDDGIREVPEEQIEILRY